MGGGKCREGVCDVKRGFKEVLLRRWYLSKDLREE